MSRIGNQPIPVKSGIKVDISDRHIVVKGPKATLEMDLPEMVDVKTEDDQVVVTRVDDTRQAKAMHGLARSLLSNMVVGVDEGFKKELEIQLSLGEILQILSIVLFEKVHITQVLTKTMSQNRNIQFHNQLLLFNL